MKSRLFFARGFSLIEILIVTAILATLAVIVFRGVASARVSGNTAVCGSNMRQIGAALIAYCTDHDGEFPETTHTQEELPKTWIYTLAPYLQKIDQVRICPADPQGPQRLRESGTSYILNEYIAVPSTDAFGRVRETFTNMRRLARPSQTITAFITADGNTSDHTHSRNWHKGWQAVTKDICPDRHRTGNASSTRLDGSANYLFADGHVETLRADEFKALFSQTPNPARPPE